MDDDRGRHHRNRRGRLLPPHCRDMKKVRHSSCHGLVDGLLGVEDKDMAWHFFIFLMKTSPTCLRGMHSTTLVQMWLPTRNNFFISNVLLSWDPHFTFLTDTAFAIRIQRAILWGGKKAPPSATAARQEVHREGYTFRAWWRWLALRIPAQIEEGMWSKRGGWREGGCNVTLEVKMMVSLENRSMDELFLLFCDKMFNL